MFVIIALTHATFVKVKEAIVLTIYGGRVPEYFMGMYYCVFVFVCYSSHILTYSIGYNQKTLSYPKSDLAKQLCKLAVVSNL